VEKNFEKYKNIIDKNLEKYVNIKSDKLKDSVIYSLTSEGKRIRGILLLLVFESITNSSDYKNILPFAVSLEMIHTYSLIHDDLPSMDNDEYRRGKSSNHIVFGEDIAILAGDALLNLAYENMVNHIYKYPAKQNIKAMRIISKAAGLMVSGQALDITHNTLNVDGKILFDIQKYKTAYLIHSALYTGAILATKNKKILSDFYTAGFYIGLSFQIKDDYNDYLEYKKSSKKTSDIINDKATYVSIFGENKAKEDIQILKSKILIIFNKYNFKNNNLSDFVEWLF